MRRKILLFVLSLFVAASAGCAHIYETDACKQRGEQYRARMDKLKTDARDQLRIGTKKEAVVHFFEQNGLPVSFTENEAYGQVMIVGCAPFGCGTDDGFLGLKVKVDRAGTVVAEPEVGGFYTNCL